MDLKEIVIDGKVYDLVPREETTPKPKKTGYEREEEFGDYFYESVFCNKAAVTTDGYTQLDDVAFESAGYYIDEKLAEYNIRADRLLRRLRRFSAIHRKNKIDWENSNQTKFGIALDYNDEELWVTKRHITRCFGEIHFDTEELARKAIEKFQDDLMWYFTEYKDSASNDI